MTDAQTKPAPINQLPPELLGSVFILVSPGGGPSLVNVLTVCRYWHDTAVDYGELWSALNLDSGTWNTSLIRSKGVPLAINSEKSLNFGRVKRMLTEYAERIQECRLRVSPVHVGALAQLLRTAALLDNLRILELCKTAIGDSWTDTPVLDLELPSLSELRLTDLTFSWRVPCMSRLVHLSILSFHESRSTIVLEALKSMGRLQTLILGQILPACEHPCFEPSKIAKLPLLSKMHLIDLTVMNCSHFGSHLDIPKTAWVKYEVPSDTFQGPFFEFHELLETTASIIPDPLQKYRLSFDWRGSVYIAIATLEQPSLPLRELSFEQVMDSAGDYASCISEFFIQVFQRFPQFTHLDITLHGCYASKSTHWWKSLRRMNQLTHLTIRTPEISFSLRKIATALGQTTRNRSEILLPHLQHLVLEDFCSRVRGNRSYAVSTAFWTMLKARQAVGAQILSLTLKICAANGKVKLDDFSGLLKRVEFGEVVCGHNQVQVDSSRSADE